MGRLLFGGTFDPIHEGHLHVARKAGRLLGAECVVLVPTGAPPHKGNRTHATAAQRLEMVRLAVANDPFLDVSDVEILRAGTSYTFDTVDALLGGPYRGDQLILLLGQDALEILPSWHRITELAARVAFAHVPRPDAPEPDWEGLRAALGEPAADALRALRLPVEMRDISSSDLRLRRREGRSVRCRVPDPVVDFIEEHGLYLASKNGESEPEQGIGNA